MIMSAQSKQNRRRGKRHPLNVSAVVTSEHEPERQIPVLVTELSMHGVGLQSAALLESERVYSLWAYDPLLPPGTKLRVRTSRRSPDGKFSIGAEVIS